jgi:hypothetical protein
MSNAPGEGYYFVVSRLTSPSFKVVSERTVVSLVTIVVSCVVLVCRLVSADSPTRAESVPPLLHAANVNNANAASTVFMTPPKEM